MPTNQEFHGTDFDIDGMEFIGCTLRECNFTYSGGRIPTLRDNHFDHCNWRFDGAALRTIQFMKMIYASGGEALVSQFIADIRNEA